MQTQIFYINTRLVYARYLFKYFSYVAHAVSRAIACWIARAVLRASPHVVFTCRACGSCASPHVVYALSRVCPCVVAYYSCVVRASSPFLRAFCRTSGSRVGRVVRTCVRSSFAHCRVFRASSARYVARVVRKLACCFTHRKLISLRISHANYISYLFDSC
jgi:hypothetical protein